MTLLVLDTGVYGIPTPRAAVFPTGTPAASPAADTGVATSVVAGTDVDNPPSSLFTNPPSAPSDLGGA